MDSIYSASWTCVYRSALRVKGDLCTHEDDIGKYPVEWVIIRYFLEGVKKILGD